MSVVFNDLRDFAHAFGGEIDAVFVLRRKAIIVQDVRKHLCFLHRESDAYFALLRLRCRHLQWASTSRNDAAFFSASSLVLKQLPAATSFFS